MLGVLLLGTAFPRLHGSMAWTFVAVWVQANGASGQLGVYEHKPALLCFVLLGQWFSMCLWFDGEVRRLPCVL